MKNEIGDILKKEKNSNSLLSNKKEGNRDTIDFVVSNHDDSDKNVLGRHYQKDGRIEIFLDRIGKLYYKEIKRENRNLFDFLESDVNKESNALDRRDFENAIDKQLFDYTADKITEVLLHELTHKFGKACHPQNYKIGRQYFINSHIDKLYEEASFSEMEAGAKELLKKCYNIQSYTTNDFNSKLWEIIDYCNYN